jgi:HK97 family phage major capsid protein
MPNAVLSAQRPIAVADQIPFFNTDQAAIVYQLESTFTNNAAEAAEGAAFGEAALALTATTSTVRKIAVALPVTDEQLSDVSGVRDYINQRLSYMIRARLDSQLLAGNGVAPNLEGLNSVSGINTTARGSDPVPDAIYKSIRKCRSVGFANPTAVFVHPSDWESIRLLRDTSGNYIWGNPASTAPETIWGVPVTVTTAATENTISMGDLQAFAGLFVRRGIDIETGWTGTQFTEGEVTIRATMRVAIAWFRASALATVTGV